MSAKLMSLGKYDNVKLYPTITQAKIDQLFQTCDVYLDINKDGEIVNAIERAKSESLHNKNRIIVLKKLRSKMSLRMR